MKVPYIYIIWGGFSKIKSQNESQNSRNQGFSYYFCMMIEGSIPLTRGSGSGLGPGSATLPRRRNVAVETVAKIAVILR